MGITHGYDPTVGLADMSTKNKFKQGEARPKSFLKSIFSRKSTKSDNPAPDDNKSRDGRRRIASSRVPLWKDTVDDVTDVVVDATNKLIRSMSGDPDGEGIGRADEGSAGRIATPVISETGSSAAAATTTRRCPTTDGGPVMDGNNPGDAPATLGNAHTYSLCSQPSAESQHTAAGRGGAHHSSSPTSPESRQIGMDKASKGRATQSNNMVRGNSGVREQSGRTSLATTQHRNASPQELLVAPGMRLAEEQVCSSAVSAYLGEYDEFCIDGWNEDDSSDESSEGDDGDDDAEDELDGHIREDDEDELDELRRRMACVEISNPYSTTNHKRAEGQKRPGDDKPPPKYQRVATEIFTTEFKYVRRLAMLTDLQDQLLRSKALGEEQVKEMFSTLTQIHVLHRDTLLPQLARRTQNCYEGTRSIGDVMKNFAPYFKMYAPFVMHIEKTRVKIIEFKRKGNSKAGSIITEFERGVETGRIPITDFLTEPMTRLLRYKLLLGEYLRLLPANHADRKNTEEALDSISEIAREVNESMRAEDNLKQTKQVQDSLKDQMDLVNPARVFLKDGRLAMICSETDRHLERHLFLFNDLLLICQPPSIGIKYKLEKQMPIQGMQILLDDDDNHFTLTSRNAVIEFLGSTPREAKQWRTEFENAIKKIKDTRAKDEAELEVKLEDELGYRAPRLVRRSTSKKCNQCDLEFKSLRRPKNHCYACGKLFCSRCSKRNLPLAYTKWLPQRVCDRCFSSLQNDAVCDSCEDLTLEQWVMGELMPPRSSNH